ncbi:MAG: hypothetical protein PHU12_00665 [Candidatus Aenigmarchaeota archaeon]|nr:hypothetical protein [Candidatus Aenigmarchaeota archaeon]
MKKAPQKAKDLVVQYLEKENNALKEKKNDIEMEKDIADFTVAKLGSDISSALLKDHPKDFLERDYNLAIDNLCKDGILQQIYSDKPGERLYAPIKIIVDMPDGTSGYLYYLTGKK